MQMRHLFRTITLVIALAPSFGLAVTLGEARVKSFLNQPLNAEIDLIGLAPGQHLDLRLRIANEDQFKRLGIAYNHFLSQLRFDVVQSGSKWVVRARSNRAVSEPFLDFPLQMNWLGGQFIKQYTFLIDPARPIRPATTTRVRPAKQPAARPVQRAVAAQHQQTTPVVGDNYGPVRRGETLWPIAKRLKPAGTTTRQMAVALLRTNPQAFINGNINRLKAGANLTIPPLEVIRELDAAAARAEFNALANGRRSTLVTSPRETRVTDLRPPQVPAEQSTAAVPAVVPAPETPEPQLRILSENEKAQPETESDAALKEQLLVTQEKIESNRIATGAIQSRLDRLEEELARMQELVDLKNEQIEALESELTLKETLKLEAEIAEGKPPVPAMPGPADTGKAAEAPTEVVKIEPIEAPGPESKPPSPYEEYLWLIWIALALLGLAALLVLFRRPQVENEDDEAAADLPAVELASAASTAAFVPTEPETEADDLAQAEKDFETLRQTPMPDVEEEPEQLLDLPELDISEVTQIESDMHEGLTNSLLDEMIEKQEAKDREDRANLVDPMQDTSVSSKDTSNFSDEDIASWVEELGGDVENLDTEVDDTESDNGDLPSILTELDDELLADSKEIDTEVPEIELDPLDTVSEPDEALVEDDAFSMSLDLARAYLEIGDKDGAKDMLKQALVGAKDPDHRRQIEELLEQID